MPAESSGSRSLWDPAGGRRAATAEDGRQPAGLRETRVIQRGREANLATENPKAGSAEKKWLRDISATVSVRWAGIHGSIQVQRADT